jgi:hypothetical protein
MVLERLVQTLGLYGQDGCELDKFDVVDFVLCEFG